MSSQYINQNKPQHQISARMKDLVLDGACDVTGTISGVNQILAGAQTVGGNSVVSGTVTTSQLIQSGGASFTQTGTLNSTVDASSAPAGTRSFQIATVARR